jgi:hypothetical protein
MRAFSAAAGLALCVFPKLAAATPLGATLVVDRSERASDCPDEPELTRQVERILQRPLKSDSGEASLEVQVSFTWSREQYFADVLSRGPKPGERVLHDRGQSCAALAEAVSVAIALLLDKELEARASGGDQASSPAVASRAEPQKNAADRARDEIAESNRASARGADALQLRATLGGGAVSGLVGQSSALLSEELGLRIQHGFIFDAGFSAVLPGTTSYGAGSVRATLLFGSARACYVWGETFSIGPCASFGVGRLRGVGIGYASTTSQDLTWSAAGVGAVAEGPVWGRVFWAVSGTLWLPTRRSSFSVQNVGTAWESHTAGGALGLGLGFRIF